MVGPRLRRLFLTTQCRNVLFLSTTPVLLTFSPVISLVHFSSSHLQVRKQARSRRVITMAPGDCKYSCQTASQTLEWINAIINFIKPYNFLINAHVVNFFQDRLWETVDQEWLDCLRREPVENLLLIPSGIFQDNWPASLKEFIHTIRSLAYPRERADLQAVLPGLHVGSLNRVLTQGMNQKKKHEVEILSAVISSIAKDVRAHKIVDVGAGQGYLAQVLSFQHELSVIAIDACSHHGNVTNARAERIKKHYNAQMHKSLLESKKLNVPQTVTCRVLSTDMLKTLSEASLQTDATEQPALIGQDHENHDERRLLSSAHADNEVSFVLAGLHACGDLSVTMLNVDAKVVFNWVDAKAISLDVMNLSKFGIPARSFLDCKEIKAVVSIGCCYNLLSEEDFEYAGSQSGFPMSNGVIQTGVSLGKRARDLACQSADRWRSLGKDAGLHNFELHAFRAGFQLVLGKYYPEVVETSPSVGRQGKTLRRHQQQRRILESSLHRKDDGNLGLALDSSVLYDGISSDESIRCGGTVPVDNYGLYEKFCHSAFCRLGLKPSPDLDLLKLWKKAEPFAELIGPYWSIRAALGPLLETLLLLDRLLFLLEQGSSIQALMVPIFDPALSPRNVAIIAKRI